MNNQTQIAAVDSPKRHVRGRFRWLGGAIVLVLGVILAGAIYESVSEAADIRAYPPPGQMVDVGGYRPVSYTHLDVYKRQFQVCG